MSPSGQNREGRTIAVSRSVRAGGWRLRAAAIAILLGWAEVLAAVGQSPKAEPEKPAAPDPAATAEGQALFRGLCSGCHGGAGRGGKGPDLTDDKWLHGGTDADIARTIQNGVPGTTMKKLGEALKPEQIRHVISYIRGLARSPSESTWKPYI